MTGVWQLPLATRRTWCWWFPASCRFRSGIPSCTGALARPSETPLPTSSARRRESKSFFMLTAHSYDTRQGALTFMHYANRMQFFCETNTAFPGLFAVWWSDFDYNINFMLTPSLQYVWSFTLWFLHWLIHSLGESLVHLLTHLFIYLPAHCFTDSLSTWITVMVILAYSFVCWVIDSLIHLLVDWFVLLFLFFCFNCWLTDSLICWLELKRHITNLCPYWLSLFWFTELFIHLIHSVI